ncbi:MULTISPECIES: exosortase A [unclassified Janthinobacterium]|uniref:exosortase A n=1 Tax=unclassified Janthinobacterium TaxID=2610881 RepID=UPI001E36C5B0|nr:MULTISPECIES: exosortase A [unclassified Janthinobacterium]MCC7641871.1 exosortase A [Janthinobacterium sp. EB271-G4-3-1]MCC7689997.1 exosortase A [Janthinobacterium sp. EB271-G4-3-2]
MSLQLGQLARLTDAAVLPQHRRQAALVALLLSLAAVVLLYHATFWSMVELWARSQTFAHGFLIVPISCWLAWRQRTRLAALAPRPSRQGLLLLGALGLAWLLADAANVPVVEQYAATAMLPACVLAILGWPAVRLLAFPLAYLFLAVPFGEVFIEPLIDFTAAFTVTALQWSGVPVFRDGSNFSLPTGNWSVVEACSGLRYLIAALALGALYAHVNCHSTRRRVAVMAAALLVPILANGVRAYLIVMLGHLSDMRLAVGVDHLIYGWLFFGLVALLLFWLAARWRELPPPRAVPSAQPVRLSAGAASPRAVVRAGVACLLLAAVWPALALASQRDDGATLPAMVLALPDPPAWRRLHDAVPDWQAPYAGTPARFAATYARLDGDGAPVGLQLHWYARQARDAELLTHQALPYGARWMPLAQRVRHVKLASGEPAVRESVLAYGGERLLVWRLYRQGGIVTARPMLVKLLLAQAKLLGRRQDGADIIVFAAYDELAPPPRARLQAFLQAALPVIEQRLQELPHGP